MLLFLILFTATFLTSCLVSPDPSKQTSHPPNVSHISIPTKSENKNFGLYILKQEPGCDRECEIQKEIELLGKKPKYILYYTDLARRFPLSTMLIHEQFGLQTVFSQELRMYSDPTASNSYLEEILQGTWDSFFIKQAQHFKQLSDTVYYRFGFEMNGDWFPWGQQAENFVQAWLRVHHLFSKAGAQRVQWVFSPNILYGGLSFENGIMNYYPGEDYVDIIAIDGYNFGTTKEHHRWSWYAEVFQNTLNPIKEHFPNKPIWLAEVASAPTESSLDELSRNKALWIRDFLIQFEEDPQLKTFIWFHYDKSEEGETNWRIDSDPQSLETFKEWLGTN